MNLAAIRHRPDKEYIYPAAENGIVCKLETARADFQECLFCYSGKQGEKFIKTRMDCICRDGYRDTYSTHIAFHETPRYFSYYFELADCENSKLWVGSDGVVTQEPQDRCFKFLWANPNDGYLSPDWSESRIYYQIFPERFRNGDRRNDPPGTLPWGSSPTRKNFMGGDLEGIAQRLDYLSDLGVNCLYLTPVFKSPSNHKYDTEDYYQIDPAFGTSEDLKYLVRKSHGRGIRVMLDGVFNHCGYQFQAFQDVVKNGERSSYKDWFWVDRFPVRTDPPNYGCFGDYYAMPKFNHANPEVQEYLIGVADYWIRETGIDGWRLDVADEIETGFWENFRREIRKKHPDVILIGETWDDAARLVYGNRLDAAMNYLFRNALVDWIAAGKTDAFTFDCRINHMLSLYSEETNRLMYNLLDSHDTSRFLHDCDGNVERLKLAVGFQMTFVGCPAIFYGDEIGLTGANDPDCRQAMAWDVRKQDADLMAWYRRMISIRKSSPVFYRGGYRTVLCDRARNLFGFIRYIGSETAYVVLNNSDEAQTVPVPTVEPKGTFRELTAGNLFQAECVKNADPFYNSDIIPYKGVLRISLAPCSIGIFVKSD